jgi:hypothetical protein
VCSYNLSVDDKTKSLVIELYKENNSIRKIKQIIKNKYGYESIRKELKKSGANLRGRGARYQDYMMFEPDNSALFAELLGYFYGDGSLHKYKDSSHGCYCCYLAFSRDEQDLVSKVICITEKLFNFKPRVLIKKSNYLIVFRQSFAKYLHNIGYPAGKKSQINPNLPLNILTTHSMKQGFIRGFLNAEASVNNSVSVQQSVRIKLSQKVLSNINLKNNSYLLGKTKCYLVRWSAVKDLNCFKTLPKSNILSDLSKLLNTLNIKSKLYFIRIYIGKCDTTSVHIELRIYPKFIKEIINLNLISCDKKLKKLKSLRG